MRDTKLRLSLVGILLLAIQLSPCHGLCSLVNGTVARCHDLDDAKYIDTYNLGTLKTSVAGNRLQAEIFRNLSSLRHLELTHGELQHIEPGTFRQLRELRSLDLSDNKLAHLDASAFDGLKKLRSLSLRKNAFKQIPSAVLNLKNLMVFEIAANPLDCNCQTLKVRDALVNRGVHLSKKILCSSPANLKGKQLVFPDTQVICMFEKQDQEMQMDQPALEGSGEVPSGDPFDDVTEDEVDEEEEEMPVVTVTSAPEEAETSAPEKAETPASEEAETPAPEEAGTPAPEKVETPAPEEAETPAPTESTHNDDLIVPAEGHTDAAHLPEASITSAPTEVSTSTEEEIVFLEEFTDDYVATSPTTVISTEATEEITPTTETDKKPLLSHAEIPVEGSGAEEELHEGSGIEGSGAGVPPISWDVPEDETVAETSSAGPAKDDGWFSLIWDTIAGTSAPPEDNTPKDLDLQEEEFISASTERTQTSSSPVEEEAIVPMLVRKNEAVGKNVETLEDDDVAEEIGHSLDDSKSGQVKAEAESTVEGADASPARQPQKGMGSYVVLAVLLAVLGALIGFAAYKGEFCTKKRKRNDVEGGTELKDMTKSLLDAGNGAQPKIASNGNLENVPLVCSIPLDDPSVRQRESGTYPDGSQMRYSAVPDVVDPVKPPRKSFVAQEDPEKALTNGRSHQDLVNSAAPGADVCLRRNDPVEPTVNGKNHHDSVSSLGTDSRGSPSARTSPPESIPTNGSLGNLQGYARPPLSPGAQRVKITLQENPDSLPKTPILITRTKAGENLVKTP